MINAEIKYYTDELSAQREEIRLSSHGITAHTFKIAAGSSMHAVDDETLREAVRALDTRDIFLVVSIDE